MYGYDGTIRNGDNVLLHTGSKLMNLHDIFHAIKTAASTPTKIRVAKQHRNNFLDYIFKCAYGGDTYGITSDQVKKALPENGHSGFIYLEDVADELTQLLANLETRAITGNEALADTVSFASMLYPDDQEILFGILDRNLRIGMSYETYQEKVMGIKKTAFEVTLAQHLEDVKGVDPLDGTWYASRKCDGVRCVAFYDSGDKSVRFISRQGKEFTTLDNLKPEVARFCKNLVGQWVLDGELCKIDENGDEHFDQIVGECRKKDYTITNCCYQLFDITHRNFFEGLDTPAETFDYRFGMLCILEDAYNNEHHGDCFIKVLTQELIKSQEDFDRWEKRVADGNWEGFMLRKNVPFEVGRTKNLLKVKKFHDAEYEVIGVVHGEIASAEPGKGIEKYIGIQSLIINHKDNLVYVGSGLTKQQRKEWHEDPSKIEGKTICVKYFQESKDKEGNLSLRFPTLKHVYDGERLV